MAKTSVRVCRCVPAVAAALLASVAAAAAQSVQSRQASGPHARVELIAAPGPAGRSGELALALRFRLDPGWHLYWRNPGDSGGPPTARWVLPPGWRAGEFEWPPPERIQLGPLVNYGHTGEVTLPVRVTGVPARPAPATISAEVRWIVCEEICVPGRGTVAITWPLVAGAADHAAWGAAIAAARARTPVAWPRDWPAGVRRSADRLDVQLTHPEPRRRPVVFPVDPGIVNDAAPQVVEASGAATLIRLALSGEAPPMLARFRAVVVFPEGRAYELDLPVRSANRTSTTTPTPRS